jgi:hypothetical protein
MLRAMERERQEQPQESDQLPEDAPAEQVVEDEPSSGDASARRVPKDTPGVPGEGGQATGHPDNAG